MYSYTTINDSNLKFSGRCLRVDSANKIQGQKLCPNMDCWDRTKAQLTNEMVQLTSEFWSFEFSRALSDATSNESLLGVARLTEKPKNRTEISKTEPNRIRNLEIFQKPNRTETEVTNRG